MGPAVRPRHEDPPAVADSRARTVLPAKIRMPRVSGLARERLTGRLAEVWQHGLCILVAPAGSGKTTLLGQFAAAHSPDPVAWYRAEASDSDPVTMLGHLEAAWRTSVGDVAGPWHTVEDAAAAIEGLPSASTLLAIDDLHALTGTPAERALERLLDYLPERVAVIAATRSLPRFNISRRRVSGTLLEIGADELRFRSWEVERLFRDIYAEPLRPEDLAELARRTEGWAAGLQLFHLSTRGKPADERHRAVAALASRSRLVREYLARNVLEGLDDEVRHFLLRTAVLGRLNGPLCDELLGRRGSDLILAELERQQLFTFALEDDGWYRFHEVLRSHAEATFVDEVGEEAARSHHRRAGALLEGAGAFVEALQAYCRAGDWEAAGRLLGLAGEELASGPAPWVDLLPEAMLQHDPRIMLAAARRHRAEGRTSAALDSYRQAEIGFGHQRAADVCRQERLTLAAWTQSAVPPSNDWAGLLRQATIRDPAGIAEQGAALPAPYGPFVSGMATMLYGRFGVAATQLETVAGGEGSPVLRASARLAAAVCRHLEAPGGDSAALEAAVDDAERAGLPWLAVVGRAAAPLAGPDAGLPVVATADGDADWGGGLADLFAGWAGLHRGDAPVAELDAARASFRRLGSPVLEGWAAALHALARARSGAPEAEQEASRADQLVRGSGGHGARAFTLLALQQADPSRADRYAAVRDAVARDFGFALPLGPSDGESVRPRTTSAPAAKGAPAPLVVTCFGTFSVVVEGQAVDLNGTKPRVRSLLRLLALNAGHAVHREAIVDALWPEADAETGTRNLQVAISALRQVLEPGVARGESSLLARDGDAYMLVVPAGGEVDVQTFRDLVDAGQAEARGGNDDLAIVALRRALDLHGGELLPAEGPAEWLLAERDHLRSAAIQAAFSLAELHARRGELVAAAFACERGLRLDQYRDGLWRMLIDLYERGGESAAAARAKDQYAAVLTELGVRDSSFAGLD